MKKYRIEIPVSALKQANFKAGDWLALSVNHKQMDLRPVRVIDQLPQISFWWYALPATIMMVIFYLFARFINHSQLIPLTGDNYSLANGAMILGVISGLVTFMTVFIVEKVRKTGPAKNFYWRSLPPLAIACGLIMLFSFSAVFWLLGQMFKDASFDIYTSTFFAFVIIAGVNYIMINLAMTLTSGVVTNLLTIMIIGGMLFSMLTNSSRDWWKHNFSFLGTAKNSTNLQFNITLIFSGLLMMVLVDYLFVNLQKKYRGKRVLVLRWLLYALSACIACIGLFPNDPRFHILHDRISMWLVYIMLIMIGLIRWILPEVTRQFLVLSYIIGCLMGLGYIFFKLSDYLSLTGFELLEFGLAFSWLLLLLQNIENLARFGHDLFLVTIVPDDQWKEKE
ncbi:DUF998 domain-containing protein [Limosilactobacillus sp.]|uniref:DUF998 domain-containing protein n=1 Tax=Limosilactobacillus sp. TaxID=2773925 RepID=UPI00359FFB63